jgi:hypothetical protein
MAYNFAKRLKSLKGKTPWQFILNQWTDHPEYFILNPSHFITGLNTYVSLMGKVHPHKKRSVTNLT